MGGRGSQGRRVLRCCGGGGRERRRWRWRHGWRLQPGHTYGTDLGVAGHGCEADAQLAVVDHRHERAIVGSILAGNGKDVEMVQDDHALDGHVEDPAAGIAGIDLGESQIDHIRAIRYIEEVLAHAKAFTLIQRLIGCTGDRICDSIALPAHSAP